MAREDFNYSGNEHIYSFPVFKRVVELDANGDPQEKFVEMSPEEIRQNNSMLLFSDIINGRPVPDTEHFDKFQLMDMLENMIAEIPEDKILQMLGKSNQNE